MENRDYADKGWLHPDQPARPSLSFVLFLCMAAAFGAGLASGAWLFLR
jgi:hypothetical protein